MPAFPPITPWPALPPLPPPGRAVLVRVPTAAARTESRRILRGVLRAILAAWHGSPADALPLKETPRGPVWPDLLGGHGLDISLSYAGKEGWLGLVRGGRIGIDAVAVPGMTRDETLAVARNYLGPRAAEAVGAACAADFPRVFAEAWAAHEARLKCAKRNLAEWSDALGDIERVPCAVRQMDGVCVAVAVTEKPD